MKRKTIQELSHVLRDVKRIGDFARQWGDYVIVKVPTIKRDKRIETVIEGVYNRREKLLFFPTIEIETMDKERTLRDALKLMLGTTMEQIAGLSIIKSLVNIGYKSAKQYLRMFGGLDYLEYIQIMQKHYQDHLKKVRKAKEDEEERQNNLRQLQGWRNGRGELPKCYYNDSYAYLRVEGKEVVTSKRAKVPIKEIKAMYKIWLHKADRLLGKEIGGFPIVKANGEWKIGCHSIRTMEILELLNTLKLPVYAELTHTNN